MRRWLTLAACLLALSTRARAQPPAAADSDVAGAYDFTFTPTNGEPIAGRLVVSRAGGGYRGVLTSAKLDAPLDTDSVRVRGGHVFASMFGGMYTFAFDVRGAAVARAVFTKTLRGASEQGPLSVRRAPRRSP